MARVVLFVGPSGHGLSQQRLQQGGALLQPPVRRGDLDRLVAQPGAPGVAILCDGVFQSEPAVSHAEICQALDLGWQVWGVSSLGAIRAHEMRTEGMRGFGWVHAQFARHDDLPDDEMCLLHLPMAPFEPLTEALVNVRHALEVKGAALGITAAQGQILVDRLGRLWFGDRSAARMRDILCTEAGVAADAAGALLAWTRQHRVKSLDLAALMDLQPWAAAQRSVG